MPVNDILLHIDSYPDPTSPAAVDRAIALAGRLKGTLTALAVEVALPVRRNRVADYLIGLSATAHEQEALSRAQCEKSLAMFAGAASSAGLPHETIHERAHLFEVSERIAVKMRTRDLCIVPLGGRFEGQQEVARSVIFGSGRPVLVFSDETPEPSVDLRRVVIAWDGSRSAARAMADAMPILKLAEDVRVLTVAGDKPEVDSALWAEALRHLALHGVNAAADVVQAEGVGIGKVIDGYLRDQTADLLVMGAYGHSRLQEFILGGATQHMLSHPLVATFMSH
ncbi:MAG: universal stress protein [Alphaproteobacteria bacterium]|nr:MAG: universal stress protein [Alphaproteobacteria bacterium]PZO35584.1 MAG: universal stress protein [Alphaproteobacteria bacterium]